MESPWTEAEQLKLAEEILREYSHLRFEVLLHAIRECDFRVSRAKGWDALVECVKAHLGPSGVSPTDHVGKHAGTQPLGHASKKELTALFTQAESLLVSVRPASSRSVIDGHRV